MLDLNNRFEFLAAAILVEGGLLAFAAAIGWWWGFDPVEHFSPKADALLWGLAATIPMFAVFKLLYAVSWGPARQIREMLVAALGPSLAVCRWYDLLLLAAVAGLGEEALFRGALQPLLGLWGSNVLFGLLHPLSLLYVLLAGAMGAYLGWLFDATQNLFAPTVTHGVYDFLAFLVVARDFRRANEPRQHEQN